MISNEYDCNRCGHRWVSRIGTKPVACPKCHSTAWDKPRREKKATANPCDQCDHWDCCEGCIERRCRND